MDFINLSLDYDRESVLGILRGGFSMDTFMRVFQIDRGYFEKEPEQIEGLKENFIQKTADEICARRKDNKKLNPLRIGDGMSELIDETVEGILKKILDRIPDFYDLPQDVRLSRMAEMIFI